MKIDAHQHFWKYSVEEYGWIDDSMSILRADHLPERMQPIIDEAGVAGTIAVQARQSLEETCWLLELADQYDFIKGVVGWVDLCSPDIRLQLEACASHPKFCAVRHVVQDEPDDRYLLRSEFLEGIAELTQFDLAYDILIFPQHLPVAAEFVQRFPDQRFVLDHIAKPCVKTAEIGGWEAGIRKLASFENIYCKVSGMVTEADWQNWKQADFEPYLDVIFDAFGIQRLMFGSDWPVCTVAGTYANVLGVVENYLNKHSFSTEALHAFWSKNARVFYKIFDASSTLAKA